ENFCVCSTFISERVEVERDKMSPSKKKKGGEWKGKLYFNPDAKVGKDEGINLSHDELQSKLASLVDIGENINEVWLYTTPLSGWQLTHALLYHAYIVLETNDYFWSLEKNADELVLQRSKVGNNVKEYLHGKKRPVLLLSSKPSQHKHQWSDLRLKNLFDHLFKKRELSKTYNWLNDNCQDFANRIYDYISNNKRDPNQGYFGPSRRVKCV
uniref:Uncharacterized protein n=1 Tax=Clytia hemisphaerica TaxID=252671 RepID=A0A7M5X7X5_9CNID